MPDTLDLAALPPARRARVWEAYRREAAAVRIRDLYPVKLARHVTDVATEETARALQGEGFEFVTGRFVRRVMREGR